jgi:hypothetical protein
MNFPLYIQTVIEQNKKHGGIYMPGSFLKVDYSDAFIYAKLNCMMHRAIHLYIPVLLSDGCYLPVIDMDEKGVDVFNPSGCDMMNDIIKKGYESIIVQSSAKSYWMILDRPCNNVESAFKCIPSELVTLNDSKYIQCSLLSQQLMLRAVPRNGFIPRIIYSNIINPLTKEWETLFISWWKQPEIEELANMQILDLI